MWKPGDKPNTPCDEWEGQKVGKGYGSIYLATWLREDGTRYDAKMLAHRLVFMQEHGHREPHEQVNHLCDNPACIRLDHLREGDAKENAADMAAKKRGRPVQDYCSKGHLVAGDNAMPRSDGRGQGRRCRKCANDYYRQYQRDRRGGDKWRPGGPGRPPKDRGLSDHRPEALDAQEHERRAEAGIRGEVPE